MLMAKPWKLEAVMRLVFSVFLCFCAGVMISVAMQVISSGKPAGKILGLDGAGLVCLVSALLLIRKRWHEGNSALRMVLALILAYGGMLLGFWSQHLANPGTSIVASKTTLSTGQMLIALGSLQGAMLFFIPGFLREHEIRPAEAFGFNHRSGFALACGALAACLFLPFSFAIQTATAWFMENLPHLSLHPEEQTAVHTFRAATSWFDRLILGFATILLAPLAEEVLFRGILYSWIKNAGFPLLAFLGTSLLFAGVHLNLLSFPALFLLALILTLLYEKTGNLLAPIAAHSLFNALNLLALYQLEHRMQHIPY
jgi:membrane protease YdiL (CAAX protease family)